MRDFTSHPPGVNLLLNGGWSGMTCKASIWFLCYLLTFLQTRIQCLKGRLHFSSARGQSPFQKMPPQEWHLIRSMLAKHAGRGFSPQKMQISGVIFAEGTWCCWFSDSSDGLLASRLWWQTIQGSRIVNVISIHVTGCGDLYSKLIHMSSVIPSYVTLSVPKLRNSLWFTSAQRPFNSNFIHRKYLLCLPIAQLFCFASLECFLILIVSR